MRRAASWPSLAGDRSRAARWRLGVLIVLMYVCAGARDRSLARFRSESVTLKEAIKNVARVVNW
jgi:hypothetical protein